MRKRLEELNWRTQPHSHDDVHEVVVGFSEPGDLPIPVEAKSKRAVA
jgi:hypothetical protein